jgi:hypothetical protein
VTSAGIPLPPPPPLASATHCPHWCDRSDSALVYWSVIVIVIVVVLVIIVAVAVAARD